MQESYTQRNADHGDHVADESGAGHAPSANERVVDDVPDPGVEQPQDRRRENRPWPGRSARVDIAADYQHNFEQCNGNHTCDEHGKRQLRRQEAGELQSNRQRHYREPNRSSQDGEGAERGQQTVVLAIAPAELIDEQEYNAYEADQNTYAASDGQSLARKDEGRPDRGKDRVAGEQNGGVRRGHVLLPPGDK